MHIAATINGRICGRLRKFTILNETGASIKLTWTVPDKCQPTISYNVTYGTIGGSLESIFFKWENKSQKQITRVLRNLIPERQYVFVISVHYNENKTSSKRPLYGISGRGVLNRSNSALYIYISMHTEVVDKYLWHNRTWKASQSCGFFACEINLLNHSNEA